MPYDSLSLLLGFVAVFLEESVENSKKISSLVSMLEGGGLVFERGVGVDVVLTLSRRLIVILNG